MYDLGIRELKRSYVYVFHVKDGLQTENDVTSASLKCAFFVY